MRSTKTALAEPCRRKASGRSARMTAIDLSDTPPRSVEDLRARILTFEAGLPKRLRQSARYVLENPEKIAVSTVAEIAEAAGVQPSAFVRFCQALGFAGFSGMQKLFRDAYAQRWPDYSTRLDRLRARGGNPGSLLGDFVEAGHKSLTMLSENLDLGTLERAVGLLCGAGNVHVVGLRRSFPVASYLAYVLDRMQVPVLLHSATGGAMHRHAIRPGDAVVAITFPPYAPETVEFGQHAARRGVPVLAITDSPASPICAVAREWLAVGEVDVGAFRSLSATVALAAALAVAVGAARSAR
jgi:DNA-binding MurR/RpiR family transcriptional regulator